MQAAIEFVLASKESEEKVCKEIRGTLLKDVPVKASDIETALSTLSLDKSRDVAVIIVVLGKYVSSSKAKERDATAFMGTLVKLSGAVGLTTKAVRAATAEVRAVGEALRDILTSKSASPEDFPKGISIFKRFIVLLTDVSTARVRVLTPLHPLVLETCVRVSQFAAAEKFLTTFTRVVLVDPKNTGTTIVDHLTFWYLSGQIYAYLRDFTKARASYFICLSTASGVASALAVAAVMKYAFCSMLLLGSAEHCPPAAPMCVTAVIQDDEYRYFRDVVDAYNKRNIDDYKSCILARENALKASKNMGLALQVVLAMRMRVVKELPLIFSRVRMDKVKKDTGVETEDEARRIVGDMIATGVLEARILPSQDGEIVEFVSAIEPGSHSATEEHLQRLMGRFSVAAQEIAEFQNILEDMNVEVSVPVQVNKALSKQRNLGGGGIDDAGADSPGSIEDQDLQAALARSLANP
eukprot:INCI15930.1.p1 GENE.INCI15930.1~~INCI15930.1.p1  ORF type:complete len:501 (-),score=92.07 INCI15930.1:74-1474(-)